MIRDLLATKLAAGLLILAFFSFSSTSLSAQCAAGESEVEVLINADPFDFPTDISWTLVDDATGTIIASRPCGFYTDVAPSSSDLVCLTDGSTYTLNLLDDYGDSWGFDATWELIRTADGCTLAGGFDCDNGVFGDNTDDCIGDDVEETYTFDPAGIIMGCTDPMAINYNSCATIDDGSCIYPAASDECVNAIEIPVNTDGTCTMTATGSLIGATYSASAGPPASSCYASETTPDDIWFKFEVPASGDVFIDLGYASDLGFMLVEYFTGTCGSLIPAPITCGPPFAVSATGLTPGDTIFMRVWDDFPLFGGATAEICVQEPQSGCTDPCSVNYDPLALVDDGSCIPATSTAEDICTDAIEIFTGSTYYDNTGSTGTDITGCTYNDWKSVWFSFVVPAGCDTLELSTCDANYDSGISLWSDCPSSGGIELDCNDDDPFFGGLCGGGLVSSIRYPSSAYIGTTVYIRLTGYNGAEGCGNVLVNCISGVPPGCVSTDPPMNPTSTVNPGPLNVNIDWDPVVSSVMCQVYWRSTASTGFNKHNYYGAELSGGVVPRGELDYGESYMWKVRCACDFDIADATPFSEADTFVLPTMKSFSALELRRELYPNPADQFLALDYSSTVTVRAVMEITDLAGRVVYAEIRQIESGSGSIRIETAGLESGFYLLNIDGLIRRFVVEH